MPLRPGKCEVEQDQVERMFANALQSGFAAGRRFHGESLPSPAKSAEIREFRLHRQ
jgi:hypothetical protein